MQSNLFIPKKIKVGFQKREDTYTGKLSYIIYFDEKGMLRKENSFESWRDHKIETLELDNKPRSGYIFNKGVQRYAYHYGSGRSMLRVYDPRDFEFEISIDNLEAVLMYSDISKKEIMGDYVFAWSGKDLILLPTASQEYQESVKYTEKQDKKVSAKELKKGATYTLKKSEEKYIYLGYFEWFYDDSYSYGLIATNKSKGKKHVFAKEYNGDKKEKIIFEVPAVSALSECVNEEVNEHYAELVIAFENSVHAKKINGYELLDMDIDEILKQKTIRISLVKKDGELFDSISANDLDKHTHYKTNDEFSEINNVKTYWRSMAFFKYRYVQSEFEVIQDRGGYGRYRKMENPYIKKIFNDKKTLSLKELLESIKDLGFKQIVAKREDGLLIKNR